MMTIILQQAVLALFVALLLWAAIEDFRTFRIPNVISLGILALYPAHLMLAANPGPWIFAVALAAIVLVIGFFFFAAGMMGAGDVKLMAATTLWVGPLHYLTFLKIVIGSAVLVAIVVALRAGLAAERERMQDLRASGSTAPGDAATCSLGVRNVTAAITGLRHAPLTKLTIPYGAAIAVGGIFLGLRLYGLV